MVKLKLVLGKQFKVEKDSKLFVHRVQGKEGEKITFDNVLMLDNASKITCKKMDKKRI